MTNSQILFSELTNNLHAYNRLQYAIKLEVDKPGPHFLAGLYQASGDLLTERKFLLEAYTKADFVIFRCECITFFVPNSILPINPICSKCQKSHERLLSNGEWQSEVERQQENLRQLENVQR